MVEIKKTPLEYNERLSKIHDCFVYLKREDTTQIRSFKIRGVVNKMYMMADQEKSKGVVCASAGNHAQGVSYVCSKLDVFADIFVPTSTPKQKIEKIKYFGNINCNIHVEGDNFQETLEISKIFCLKNEKTFIHPYDDLDVILGQGTIADEIEEDFDPSAKVNIVVPVGGGGLLSGIILKSPKNFNIIGVESEYAQTMKKSLSCGVITPHYPTDSFVDGVSVGIVGTIPFDICNKTPHMDIEIVDTGKLCKEILNLYTYEGIIVEPAGCLSIAALDQIQDKKDKNFVCIVSGGNNDVKLYTEIDERYKKWTNLYRTYTLKFVQKSGALKNFVNTMLGDTDDIVKFEYVKTSNSDNGNVVVEIHFENKSNIEIFEKKAIFIYRIA